MAEKITARQFAEEYAANSNLTLERLARMEFLVVPCHCGDYEYCRGWQMAHDLTLIQFDMERGKYTADQIIDIERMLEDDSYGR